MPRTKPRARDRGTQRGRVRILHAACPVDYLERANYTGHSVWGRQLGEKFIGGQRRDTNSERQKNNDKKPGADASRFSAYQSEYQTPTSSIRSFITNIITKPPFTPIIADFCGFSFESPTAPRGAEQVT
jgi:hypothetical protein